MKDYKPLIVLLFRLFATVTAIASCSYAIKGGFAEATFYMVFACWNWLASSTWEEK